MARHGDAAVTLRVVEAGGAPLARIVEGTGAVAAFALHAGHDARPGFADFFGISEEERRREEDPHTAEMAPVGVTLVEVVRSRFEVDLNRPRFRAVYQGPKDAWGLRVWRGELPDHEDRTSRAEYDTFYAAAFDVLSRLAEKHRRFVVLDLHSYNHRREGVDSPPAPGADNPEVNLGTRHIDRERWAPLVEAFSAGMRSAGFDVGENVKFGGGHFSEWVAETFPEQGCPLAIEFKKTYMDEWTGEVDDAHVARIRAALTGLLPTLTDALDDVQ